MKKIQRIEELERQVRELQEQVRALQARPVYYPPVMPFVPAPPPAWPSPAVEPYYWPNTVTCGGGLLSS